MKTMKFYSFSSFRLDGYDKFLYIIIYICNENHIILKKFLYISDTKGTIKLYILYIPAQFIEILIHLIAIGTCLPPANNVCY